MPNTLTASIRRQIIEFNPDLPDAVSISDFCSQLGISRPSYYKVKKRYLAEGNGALNPHSRAPKTPARVHGDQTTVAVLRLRERLRKSGWDNGPQSIWFEGVDTHEFGETIPSVATIGRILAEAGVTRTNPRKRPRSAWMRFVRSFPMELWQLDGLEYRLFDPDGTKALIYQLIGATRGHGEALNQRSARLRKLALSAKRMTGRRQAADTRFGSSNEATAVRVACETGTCEMPLFSG